MSPNVCITLCLYYLLQQAKEVGTRMDDDDDFFWGGGDNWDIVYISLESKSNYQ